VPAPGQGAIAVEARADDPWARGAVIALDDPVAAARLAAERALVAALGGGCRLPLGALATVVDEGTGMIDHLAGVVLELTAAVVSPDGARFVRRSLRGTAAEAAALGSRLAAALVEAGADEILRAARAVGTPAPPAP
jgi:hydroxymethylbilane synthase